MKLTDYTVSSDGMVLAGKNKEEALQYVNERLRQSDVLARAFARYLPVRSFFEASCGLGTNLVAFSRLGCSVTGSEFGYMLQQVVPEARSAVIEMDLGKPSSVTGTYDLVLCSEVLEHIEGDSLDIAIENLKHLVGDCLAVTVPLINPGYETCADHIAWDHSDGRKWSRKLTQEELWKNSDGTAVMGHITMATERWWEEIFARHGLFRDRRKELQILQELESGGIATFYNLFLLRTTKPSHLITAFGRDVRRFKKLTPGDFLLAVEPVATPPAQGGPYACLLTAREMESGSGRFEPGELRFISITIENRSPREFVLDSNDRHFIRIGTRFRGRFLSRKRVVQNLPVYLGSERLLPGEKREGRFQIKAPYRPGRYQCEISLVEEGVAWFCDAERYPGNAIRFSIRVA